MEKNISKAKVLVCDDSMMVRNKMKKLLTAYGFTQIFEASDGAQAVEKFADIVPDVTSVSYTHLTLPTNREV